MTNLFKTIVVISCFVFCTYTISLAGEVSIPNEFSAGSPAVAAEVNENFSEVKASVDDNNSKIDTHIDNTGIHQTKYTDTEAVTAVLDADGSGSGLDADTVDGRDSTEFIHSSGDTMTGTLTVPGINYSSPRTHHFVVGSEAFVPVTNIDYINSYAQGGAYILSGSGALVAPVHLPHGAEITEFTVYFYDMSTEDLSVQLYLQSLTRGSYSNMAKVVSSGALGYDNDSDTAIGFSEVDNTINSYLVYAHANSWDGGNLKIKGAVITYTISEAP